MMFLNGIVNRGNDNCDGYEMISLQRYIFSKILRIIILEKISSVIFKIIITQKIWGIKKVQIRGQCVYIYSIEWNN